MEIANRPDLIPVFAGLPVVYVQQARWSYDKLDGLAVKMNDGKRFGFKYYGMADTEAAELMAKALRKEYS